MSVIPFKKAAAKTSSASVSSAELSDENFETYFAMFSSSEQLTLGLLMGRKDQNGQNLFKDIQLEANELCASLALRFNNDERPYMHIDKLRSDKTTSYLLRRENMPTITRDNLNDIYEIARDDVNAILGEPPFEISNPDQEPAPHIRLIY